MPEVFVVIMAGGRGARFWPRSRRHLPKQCLSIDGGETLIQQTVSRMRPLADGHHVLVITGNDMVDAITAQLPTVPKANILVEPQGRNTAPCVGLAAAEIARRAGGDAVMVCLPADHVITDEAALLQSIEHAIAAAVQQHALVTLGITPTHPETGYGYLELGEPLNEAVSRVAQFREKPDHQTAEQYVRTGRYLWNAGMFVFAVQDILNAFEQHLPRSAAALAQLIAQPDQLETCWKQLDAISIDYGIMERSDNILTVPCNPGWSDVGSWDAVAPLMPLHGHHRAVAQRVVSIGADPCVVYAPGKVVALVGVEDITVVDSPDALLIIKQGQGQRVRDVVDELEQGGRSPFT